MFWFRMEDVNGFGSIISYLIVLLLTGGNDENVLLKFDFTFIALDWGSDF